MLEDDTSMIGKRLRQLRREMGWTLEDVAAITGAASRQVPGNWETGHRTPPHGTLLSLARWYGVSLDYLYGVRGADRDSPLVRLGRAALRDRFPQAVKAADASTPTARIRVAVGILNEVAPEAFFPARLAASLMLHEEDYGHMLQVGEATAPVIDRFAELAGIPVQWFYQRLDTF